MSTSSDQSFIDDLAMGLIEIISETNGINLSDTLELMIGSDAIQKKPKVAAAAAEFRNLLFQFQSDQVEMDRLLSHPMAKGLFAFFKAFPIPYRDEHTHLTGALAGDYIYPRLKKLLEGPNKAVYEEKIKAIYGPDSLPIKGIADVDRLLKLKDDERFSRYLSILMLPKLVLTDRKAHRDAAYHMATELYRKYNVGFIRLKFTFSRATSDEAEKVPGLDLLTEEEIVLGLYDGFMDFKKEVPEWEFTLSPVFRKEAAAFDAKNYKTKQEHFLAQVEAILALIKKYPFLRPVMNEVDTVGNEVDLHRKSHFMDMKIGFRKLQSRGFKVRSHHGEIFRTLRRGIQAVDNAMNIWRIDTLEHGLSLGINPNFYFHSVYSRVLKWNKRGEAIRPGSPEFNEVMEMDWPERYAPVRDKLIRGEPLDEEESRTFTKTKFHTAREVEIYQHDVLDRMIDKGVSLVSLPSSNRKLTHTVEDYKDHPFSWWEKKGLGLGIGTDNYVTLNTNFIQELLIVLFADPQGMKIMKLLMIATGEERRPYLSHVLWEMRKSMLG